MKKTDLRTLSEAMRLLAPNVQSDDGVASMAIMEAAERLEELHIILLTTIPIQCRKEIRFSPPLCRDCSHFGFCQARGGYGYE